jgi:membrane protease subunit (stomatin/prohibitin family)
MPYQYNQAFAQPTPFAAQQNMMLPPYNGSLAGGFCTRCGMPRQNPMERFCPSCGQAFNF